MSTPTVPDGPDTELAAAIAWFREDPTRLDFAPITEWSRHLRTIVRAYFARPAAGRDLPDVEDGPTAVELLDALEGMGAALVEIGIAVGLPRPSGIARWGAPEILARIATLDSESRVATPNSELEVPPRAEARIAQARTDQAEGYGSTTSTVEGLLRELDRRGGELVRLRAAIARPAVACTDGPTNVAGAERPANGSAPGLGASAPTDGQPPADEWRVTGWTPRGSRVTADRRHRSAAEAEATAMRDEGLSDVRVEHRAPAAPADDTAAATAPWMVESRDERVDRLTRHVENVADCAGIEIEVREAGPLTGPAPLRRLVRALEGAGMLHDDPADDTAAPDGPTADEAVASAARIVEAWAHLRMDTPEDQATHDELVRVSRATIAAYVRTRPWSSAGQPVRGSQTEAES